MKFAQELVFLAKFSAVFLISEAVLFYGDFSVLENFLASSQAAFFDLASSRNIVFVSGGAFEITSSCTGLVSASILGAIIFSLKKPELKKKIMVFCSGLALLLVLNYLRVLLVIGIGKNHGIAAAEIAHVASWFATAAFVILLWYYFTKRITGAKDFSGFL